MADIDLKTETPDTSLPTTGFVFGADSQSAATPSVYPVQSLATTLLGSTTLNGVTVTADAPVWNFTQTWDNAAVTFTGLKANITDTASNASSLLMDLQMGGSSKVRIDKTGAIVNLLNTYGTSNFALRGGNSQNFGLNLQGSAAYFQTTTNVVAAITAQGTAGSIGVSNTGFFGFHTTVPGADALDTILTRRAAANLRLGAADAAAPVAQTLSVQSVSAGTSNTAGANLTITGSQGTGTGAGGSIVFQVAPAGSSGTAQNALSTALTIDSNTLATFESDVFFKGTVADFFYATIGLSTTGKLNPGITVGSGTVIGFSSTANWYGTRDVLLARDAANTLALRNGTNGQTQRVYGTYTDASNYRRLALTMSTAGVAELKPEGAGTGASGNVLHISGLPASNPGAGILWNDGGTVKVGT
jgi:hypothetical protein